MSQLVTTSLIVNFTTAAGSQATLAAEIDSRADGLNLGSTQFVAGDSPGFIMFYTTGVVVDTIKPSEGTVVSLGTATITKEQDITFANTREASLSTPCNGAHVTVVRKTPGAPDLNLLGESKVITANKALIVAAYHVTYTATGHLYRITGAAGNVPVVVFISGTG